MPPELNGVWSILPQYLKSVIDSAPLSAAGGAVKQDPFRRNGKIALVALVGPLSKAGCWWCDGTSTVHARSQLRAAGEAEDVSGVVLFVDSPGGTAAGTLELANEVALTAAKKPVYAFISDLGASAAYWPASQATKVFVNPTGIVGSIGTYMIVADLSGMAEKAGIKVHVIRAGEFKGAGVPGTKIEDAHLAQWQKNVDDINAFFVAGVAKGRRITQSRAKALADGRTYVGQAAVSAGLVDGVASLESVISHLASGRSGSLSANSAGTPQRNQRMDDDTAIANFEEAVSALQQAHPCWTRLQCVAQASKAAPDRHAAYIEASNRLSQAKQQKQRLGR